jgi:hypothetical protein
LPFLSSAYAGVLVVLGGRPTLNRDAGVFLSVAGRLLDGDRLYAEVYDNKDPLFYYAHAVALEIGGWRGPFLLDVFWLTIGALATAWLLRSLGGSRLLVGVGIVVYPLLFTGAPWYYAGYSSVAAVSLAPVVCWLWVRGSPGWAGVFLSVALLFKVSLVLVLVSGLAALTLARWPPSSVRSHIGRAAGGCALGLASVALVLVLRGELKPYFEVQVENFGYANAVLVTTGRRSGVVGHLQAVHDNVPHFPLFAALLLIAVACALAALVRGRPGGGTPSHTLAALFIGTSAATALTLALTAAWDQHLQVLAWPGVLFMALLLAHLEAVPGLRLRIAGLAATLGLGMFLLVWVRAPGSFPPVSDWRTAGHSDTADAVNTAALDPKPGYQVTYAHLGANDEEAHAAFLGNQFELVCPRFHQYPFSPYLRMVLRCLEGKRPDLVFVTPSFRRSGLQRWDTFVADGERFLHRAYVKVLERRSASGPIQVWSGAALTGGRGSGPARKRSQPRRAGR